MRLPRRTPWSSLAELDQLCSWVYYDDDDRSSKILAVERLSAWKAITALPHALESLLALLAVILQDNNSGAAASSLSVRQSYAGAVIRLVNGLVDPLQAGMYARPIASIAAQLNLPAWLVELRHAATHEDLPSLELLRVAATESMDWLLHHYFLPTLNTASDQAVHPATMRSLGPTLKRYKTLLKTITRDTSLRSQYQPDIARILRDVERWIAEARVAANVTTDEFVWELGGQVDDTLDGEDSRETWALERLGDELLVKGVLIPISKKKRAPNKGTVTPPKALLALWAPLLENVHCLHPTFPSVLSSRVVSRLLGDEHDATPESDTISLGAAQDDPSYNVCVASWAMWCINTSDSGPDSAARKEELFFMLVNGLGPQLVVSDKSMLGARSLLKALCSDDARLRKICSAILADISLPSREVEQWDEAHIDVMDERLNAILAMQADSASTEQTSADTDIPHDESSDVVGLPLGWHLLSENTGWKPRPIGVV